MRMDMKSFGMLLGRWFICAIFLISAVQKILTWDTTSTDMVATGLQVVPLFLVGAILIEFFGGLSLLLGARAKLGALLLAIYLIPVTALFHNFWTLPVGSELWSSQLTMFLKNCAIFGGLLYIISTGAGNFSRDRRREKNAEEHTEKVISE
ncbi:MAG: DoxX family protein [Nitrosomonas sp.]|nr:MAG: DoxX family protein [Nitrosomonas sp.]